MSVSGRPRECARAPRRLRALAVAALLAAPVAARAADAPEAGAHLLILGDSYAVGTGVAREVSWPVQLKRALVEGGKTIGASAVVGRAGFTTADVLATLEQAPLKGPFDLVLVQIGANDLFQRRPEADFRRDFAALVRRAIDLAGGRAKRVIVLSIPDWSVTPFAAQQGRTDAGPEIERFNAIEREEVARAGAVLFDATTSARDAAKDPGLLADDGLHPSARLHERWARGLAAPAAAALSAE